MFAKSDPSQKHHFTDTAGGEGAASAGAGGWRLGHGAWHLSGDLRVGCGALSEQVRWLCGSWVVLVCSNGV